MPTNMQCSESHWEQPHAACFVLNKSAPSSAPSGRVLLRSKIYWSSILVINPNFRGWVLAYAVESLRKEMGKEHTEALVMISMNCLKVFISTILQNNDSNSMKTHKAKTQMKANNLPLTKKLDKNDLRIYTVYVKIPSFLNRKTTKNNLKLLSQNLIFSMFKIWNNIHKNAHLWKLLSYTPAWSKNAAMYPIHNVSDQLPLHKWSWDLCKLFDSDQIRKDMVCTSPQIAAFLFTACEHCSFCTFSYAGLAHRCWHCCPILPEDHVHQTSSHWGGRAMHEHKNHLPFNPTEDVGWLWWLMSKSGTRFTPTEAYT